MCVVLRFIEYPGSYRHFELDANTFAEWEVDSLKFDGCNANASEYDTMYPAMGAALNNTGRSIAYICGWPLFQLGHANLTLVQAHCNSWRNFYDIQNSIESLNGVIDWFAKEQAQLIPVAGPGGWNDPDMIIAGNNCLTPGQARIQMSIWAILAAPLMLGSDIRSISSDIKAVGAGGARSQRRNLDANVVE